MVGAGLGAETGDQCVSLEARLVKTVSGAENVFSDPLEFRAWKSHRLGSVSWPAARQVAQWKVAVQER